MLEKRTSDKGRVYLFDSVILITYHNAKRELTIPAAKIKIYCEPELCELILRPVFLFTKNKRWDELVGVIITLGGEHAFTYRTGTGFLDTSIKQSEIDMSEI